MNCLAATITFNYKPFSDMAVAIDPHNNGFPQFSRSSQRCRLQSLTNLDYKFFESNTKQNDLEYSSSQAFEDDTFHRSVSTPCFSFAAAAQLEEYFQTTAPRIEILGGRRMPSVRSLVAEVTMAMICGAQPLLLPNGLGGAYLLRTGKGHNIAVAKPVDEEHLAFNNPKESGGLMLGQQGMKRSILVGETGIRELAAYVLDHQGFASVPPTALVRISHVPFHVSDTLSLSTMPYKIASLQRFVSHDFDAGELGPGSFSVASVHRIGILDVRLLNLDRHSGNMLVKRGEQREGSSRGGVAELVPIDHGLCLPEFLDDPYFEWLNWPQASVPFTDPELQYISNLDPFKDAELLRTDLCSIRESSVRVLIVCTILLKQAAAAGLCLAEIGEMMTREWDSGEERPSVLENLCSKAKSSVVGKPDEDGDYSWRENDAETVVESEIFQLNAAVEGTICKVKHAEDLHMSKPPICPIFPHASSTPANLSTCLLPASAKCTVVQEKITESNLEKSRGVGCMVRSKSQPSCVNHEKPIGISFGDMSTCEWEMFLQRFHTLLAGTVESSNPKWLKARSQ